MKPPKPFYHLTRRGRGRRLRQMALVALSHYDLSVARLRILSDGWNTVFRVDAVDGRRLVLRISYPGKFTAANVRSEMMWLEALRRDTDITVPVPVRTRNDDLLTTVMVPGVPEPRHCVLFGWVPGVDLIDDLTPQTYGALGELMARLHRHAAAWTPPNGFTVTTANTIYNPNDEPVLLDEQHRHLLSPAEWHVYEETVQRVGEMLVRLYEDPTDLRVIHYDLHPWNLKVYRGQLHPIDFEDLTWGYPSQDVGLSLYYIARRPDFEVLQQSFRQGYTRHLPWPMQHEGELALHMARRLLDFANLFAGSTDPAERAEARPFLQRGVHRLAQWLQIS